MTNLFTSLPSLFLLSLLLSLTLAQSAVQTSRTACLSQPTLICVLTPTAGNTASGTVRFQSVWRSGRPSNKCLVRITAAVSGLSEGRHGFHIHTYGDVSVLDGTSAGGHFTKPSGADVPHGFSNEEVRHWGDFGNLKVGADGNAGYRRVDRVITIKGILGRGMIVHELADKGSAFQPTGDAGSRQAMCVIGVANPGIL